MKDRREFLQKLGFGLGAAALATQCGAAARALLPNVSYDPPTTVKLGFPAELPQGMKFFAAQRLFVFRDGNVLHAISAVCTHLGCTVRAETLTQPATRAVGSTQLKLTHRFVCPCHGSRYEGDGTNVAGPAPAPLAWYHLSLAPDDGQLVVDLARAVPHDFRLTLT